MTDDIKSENGDVDGDSDVFTQMSMASSHEYSSFLISPYWLQDERMRKGEVDFLSNREEDFWKALIEKYLRPIETDEESQVGMLYLIRKRRSKINSQKHVVR